MGCAGPGSLSVLAALVTALCFVAVGAHSAQVSSRNSPPHQTADQLMLDVVWNEAQAQKSDHTHWRYRELQQEDGKDQLLDVVQTRSGEIHRVLAVNGKPLTGKQLEAEERRVQKILDHSEQIQEAQKKRNQDGDEELKLLQMLPNAFHFSYDGEQNGAVNLRFTPNPDFHPATREAEVFHHMEGTILVDGRLKRMLEINGRLTSKVKFFGGFLGHLDEGGTFCVKQRNVGSSHWDMTLLDVHMDGKALFFKTIAVRQKEVYSDYQQVPPSVTLEEAVRLLEKDSSS